ncbi:MAG: hypothetical protein Q4P66_06610 [Actinomycetaceae bacterium]|nr:hypothetical protein [Actinomycetaceae bacterium]
MPNSVSSVRFVGRSHLTRRHHLRIVAIVATLSCILGLSAVSAYGASISVSFWTNVSFQRVHAGEPIRTIWFSVTTSSKNAPSFSLSSALPYSQLEYQSNTVKGISAKLPRSTTPGFYTVNARVSVEGKARYARATVEVLPPADPANPIVSGGHASSMAAANYQTCVVTPQKTVQCWGRNVSGQVGASPSQRIVARPQTVPGLSNITHISAGNTMSCALRNDGRVFCWGDNSQNQLGYSSVTSSSRPVRVNGLPTNITAITSGASHSCALTQTGQAYCWGSSQKGQLGNGTAGIPFAQAVRVSLTTPLKSISAGAFHTCAVTNKGQAYCWGQNNLHQLGSVQTKASNAANPVPQLVSGNGRYLSVHSGYDYTCAITTSRTVDCWGSNSNGQIGANLAANSHSEAKVPTRVTSLSNVYQLSTGYYHACALDGSNHLKCWGQGKYSQLGPVGSYNRTVPADTTLGTRYGTVAQLRMGAAHSCLLTTAGQVYCWGNQSSGQLGDGVEFSDVSSQLRTTSVPVPPQW